MDNSNSNQIDINAYEELMELVFAYTAAAQDFGFTHKMNNRFTSLSMNASFLKQALENKDYEKAIAKAAQVSESINSLVSFSQNLMNTDQIPAESQELTFPTMLSDTVGKLLKLPTFNGIKLQQDLATEIIITQTNPRIIWIFLYAYLKHAKRYTIEGPIFLSTSLDKENMQYVIKTSVKRILTAPPIGTEEDSLTFPSAGEVPLRYLARVIRNVSNRIELIHHTERPLSLELIIKLSSI